MVNTTRIRNLPDRPTVRAPHPDTVPFLAVSKFLMDWHLAHPEQQDEYMVWLREDAARRAQKRNASTAPSTLRADQCHTGTRAVRPLMCEPLQGCALPSAERPVPEAAPVLDFEAALRWRIAREQAYKLTALYDGGRYRWQDGSVAPKRERIAA